MKHIVFQRCSRPLCSSQRTVDPPTISNVSYSEGSETKPTHTPKKGISSLGLQDPIMCTKRTPTTMTESSNKPEDLRTTPTTPADTLLSNVPPMSTQHHTFGDDLGNLRNQRFRVLLRKEVIQPHLPVRLPCYDLVLITSPTFDGSLHKG